MSLKGNLSDCSDGRYLTTLVGVRCSRSLISIIYIVYLFLFLCIRFTHLSLLVPSTFHPFLFFYYRFRLSLLLLILFLFLFFWSVFRTLNLRSYFSFFSCFLVLKQPPLILQLLSLSCLIPVLYLHRYLCFLLHSLSPSLSLSVSLAVHLFLFLSPFLLSFSYTSVSMHPPSPPPLSAPAIGREGCCCARRWRCMRESDE